MEDCLRDESIELLGIKANSRHYLFDTFNVRQAIKSALEHQPIDAVIGWHHEVSALPRFLRRRQIVFGMFAAGSYAQQGFGKFRLMGRVHDIGGHAGASVSPATALVLPEKIQALKDYITVVRPMRQAQVVFARSDCTAKQITDLFAIRPECITTTYPSVDYVISQRQRKFNGKVQRLIYFGSLTKEKGIFDLIRAMGRVSRSIKLKWNLRIAGWGNWSEVQQLAEEERIDHHIKYIGSLSHEELFRELQQSDLAVLPSHAESFGLAIAEAQAFGVPVVACSVGAIPEVISHEETGLLVSPQNPSQLAQAIEQCMRAPKRSFEMGQAGSRRIRQQFSSTQSVEIMLKAITQLKSSPATSIRAI